MIKKSLSLLILTSALSSQAFSAESPHHFEMGAGIGGTYGNFNINRAQPGGAPGVYIRSNYDLSHHSLAGNISLGYQYHLPNNWVLGLEADYLFDDMSRKNNPYDTGNNATSLPSKIESKGAYGAVAKVGYVFDKKFLFALGAGIEGRRFKVEVLDNDPTTSYEISKTTSQVAFAARLEAEYKIRHNMGLGLQWRKAFYQKKTFRNTEGSIYKFNPKTLDTVLVTLKYKFNTLPF